MIYCEARLLRAGLANRLFPWARARIWSRTHNVPMLFPQWVQVPIGTLIRREKDLRTYTNLFQPAAGDVTGLAAAYVRVTAQKVPEPDTVDGLAAEGRRSRLVVFEGMRGQFAEINSWSTLLKAELEDMTRPMWRQRAQAIPVPFIALHVRRGDFQRTVAAADLVTTNNAITPIGWFVATLRAVRAALGETLPAIVTSDGSDAELSELLGESHVTRADTGSAIGDMLLLSRSKVLLASGSSFSAWASFLGQMPTLSHPGQGLTRLFGLKSSGAFLGEFDPANPGDFNRADLTTQAESGSAVPEPAETRHGAAQQRGDTR